jgi:HSP20 family protein
MFSPNPFPKTAVLVCFFVPFGQKHAMANLTKANRGREMDPWRDFMDFDFLGSRLPPSRTTLPAVNISEDEKGFGVEVVAPGFKKEDFRIKVDDDVLTISAENKQESKEGNGREYSRREYSYSSFTRSFRLPENAKDDAISARYENGILHLQIPKTARETKATKEISIQ